LISLTDTRAHACQLKVWLGDTPLLRGALDDGRDIFEGWMTTREEDRVLLKLVYDSPGSAVDAIASNRSSRFIDHARLDALAHSYGLDTQLATARAAADALPDD
jgi:hypothetical protein